MRFVISADSDLSIFRRTQASTFKGLLSIPSHGRGARRPLGQSFRESVGPAALYQASAANRRDDLLIRAAYDKQRVKANAAMRNLSFAEENPRNRASIDASRGDHSRAGG